MAIVLNKDVRNECETIQHHNGHPICKGGYVTAESHEVVKV